MRVQLILCPAFHRCQCHLNKFYFPSVNRVLKRFLKQKDGRTDALSNTETEVPSEQAVIIIVANDSIMMTSDITLRHGVNFLID